MAMLDRDRKTAAPRGPDRRHRLIIDQGPPDEVEWQGGRVYLYLGARRDDPPRG
jgi:hypothetical protein